MAEEGKLNQKVWGTPFPKRKTKLPIDDVEYKYVTTTVA